MISVDDLLDAVSGEKVIWIRESHLYPMIITCNGTSHTQVYTHDSEIIFKPRWSRVCQCLNEQETIYEKWSN